METSRPSRWAGHTKEPRKRSARAAFTTPRSQLPSTTGNVAGNRGFKKPKLTSELPSAICGLQVEAVIEARQRTDIATFGLAQFEFLVEWQGLSEASWEPYENLEANDTTRTQCAQLAESLTQ